jgi:hypothetical protein
MLNKYRLSFFWRRLKNLTPYEKIFGVSKH